MAIVMSGENGDLGKRFKDFEIEYTVTAESGNDIKVTEAVGSSVTRTCTVASGEKQTLIVPLEGLILGQHTVTITATVAEETVERVYTFTVPAVWIDCEEADLADKMDSFAVAYVPGSYSKEEVTVTEFLDSEQKRTYVAESGSPQSMAIDMRSMEDGEHSISVTAACGEDEWTTTITFVADAFTLREGGSVQELQDETGAPVFPVTLAKATIMTDGRSAEMVIRDMKKETFELGRRAVEIDLLWANASPSSSFSAQTISLDLSGYRYVLILASYSDNEPAQSLVIPVGYRAGVNMVRPYDSGYVLLWRGVTVTNTGIAFGNAENYQGGTYTATYNIRCVPIRIYGIKEVN